MLNNTIINNRLKQLKNHLSGQQQQGMERIFISEIALNTLRELGPKLKKKSGEIGKKELKVAEFFDKKEKIQNLIDSFLINNPFQKLDTLRETLVFSTGTPNTEIVIVGEAPGHEEERQKAPFVGPAGQKLNQILNAMGLERENLYITNIVKYRPAIGENQGTRNRKPSEEELQCGRNIVLKEIAIIKPKVIIACGATAIEGLLEIQETVMRARGQDFSLQGIPVICTYHPSYLLRNDSLQERRKVWEDMLRVMELLKMPISKKQRDFFLPKS